MTATVVLGNFDVEHQWAAGEPGLPAPSTSMATAVVASTDELALLLGHRADWVVVKSSPDGGLVDQLRRVGLTPPAVLVADENQPTNTVTEDALASSNLLERLRTIAAGGACLAPHGYSPLEAALCRTTGLTPPMASPEIAKTVNSKVYSRRLCRAEGIEQPPGWECETRPEFMALGDAVRARIDDGATLGVKAAYGVSGKGIMLLERAEQFDRLARMLTRQATRLGDERLLIVVEEWQDKRTDLNYHLTVGTDGESRFDFVLEAVTEAGTHRGHRLPTRLGEAHDERIRQCAEIIGRTLSKEGYRGPVGVDAIITTDGTLFPVIEINARNNMSTYLTGVAERLGDAGSHGLAMQVDLQLSRPIRYDEVAAALDGEALDPHWRRGFLVTCFASLNAAAPFTDGSRPFRGRLHGVAVGSSTAEVVRLEQDVRARLRTLENTHD